MMTSPHAAQAEATPTFLACTPRATQGWQSLKRILCRCVPLREDLRQACGGLTRARLQQDSKGYQGSRKRNDSLTRTRHSARSKGTGLLRPSRLAVLFICPFFSATLFLSQFTFPLCLRAQRDPRARQAHHPSPSVPHPSESAIASRRRIEASERRRTRQDAASSRSARGGHGGRHDLSPGYTGTCRTFCAHGSLIATGAHGTVPQRHEQPLHW